MTPGEEILAAHRKVEQYVLDSAPVPECLEVTSERLRDLREATDLAEWEQEVKGFLTGYGPFTVPGTIGGSLGSIPVVVNNDLPASPGWRFLWPEGTVFVPEDIGL